MTLDPVHFEGITRLARRIEQTVDRRDHREFAETVWEEFLDPLVDAGTRVLEPLDDQRLRAVPIDDVALADDQFPTRHGLDSGTINPTTYRNGMVIDVAQAAMSAIPSDLDLHRARTVVEAVHSGDATVDFDADPQLFDDGYVEGQVLHTPRVNRYEGTVVHELALYLAESKHALRQAEVVEDLLVLDGPIYPKGMLNWADRDPELAGLLETERPQSVVANYVELVERFVARDVPMVGFVKTARSRAITRTVRSKRGNAPWVNDAAFFAQVLERRERVDGDLQRRTDDLTFTNWFVSRGGADGVLSSASDALGIDRELPPEDYEVTFFAVYDPRDDAVYRVEAPRAFARDTDRRERLTRQLLAGVARERGPPKAVAKADELARISREGTRAVEEALAETFDADPDRSYDDRRWQ
jgi:hypothetical protein